MINFSRVPLDSPGCDNSRIANRVDYCRLQCTNAMQCTVAKSQTCAIPFCISVPSLSALNAHATQITMPDVNNASLKHAGLAVLGIGTGQLFKEHAFRNVYNLYTNAWNAVTK